MDREELQQVIDNLQEQVEDLVDISSALGYVGLTIPKGHIDAVIRNIEDEIDKLKRRP